MMQIVSFVFKNYTIKLIILGLADKLTNTSTLLHAL